MKRIEFVRKVALGAGYVAVVGCMSACKPKTSKTEEPVKASAEPKAEPTPGFNIDLSDPKYADLEKPGSYITVKKYIIARTNEGELVAFNKRCTHKGGPLAYNANAGRFQCPWHGAQFSGQGVVLQGPATKNLKAHKVETNGKIITIIPG